MSLDNAAVEVKLAIDLIMLLEQQALSPQVVLDALTMVQKDYQRKLEQDQDSSAL